jgi:phosphoribosylglycinamide formyltransferase-1
MLNIAVLVSGGGTNLQALIDAIDKGGINGRITAVISNRPGAYALERAEKSGIPVSVIERKNFESNDAFDRALLEALRAAGAELIVLAGFLSILGAAVTDEYKNRIINVHPSLIPSFCGDGYYGLRVHKAVLKYGVRVTGATVHFVNDAVDGGAIILQKAVEVRADDTPETLQQRVMKEAEWVILPRAVALFCEGKIVLEKDRVFIRE